MTPVTCSEHRAHRWAFSWGLRHSGGERPPGNLSSLCCTGCRSVTRPQLWPSGSVLRDKANEKANQLPREGAGQRPRAWTHWGACQGYRGCCRRGHSCRGSGGCHPARSPTKNRKGKFTYVDGLGVWGLQKGLWLLFYLLTHSCKIQLVQLPEMPLSVQKCLKRDMQTKNDTFSFHPSSKKLGN